MSENSTMIFSFWKKTKELFLVFFACCLVLIIEVKTASSQNNRKNLGFESGTFNGWTGYTWMYRKYGTDVRLNTPIVEGIYPGRHSIISNKNAYDSNTGNQLKMIPDGYNYSAKLGTELVLNNYETNSNRPGGQHQSLTYTMKIDSSNALVIWKFAVVLEDPSDNHEYDEEPRFKISLYDENGDTISDCSYYDVYAGDASIKGFKKYTPPGDNPTPVVWRDWTTVGANLLPFYGQTITIEFLSAACTHRGHYGYGYFVLDCLPLYITVDYCKNSKHAELIAPEGFESYAWVGSQGAKVGSDRILSVENPKEGSKYTCTLTSETGCTVSLNSTILRFEPIANFSSKMVDCINNEVLFTNNSTIINGKMDFLWDFGDGNTSKETNPVYKFASSGLHQVSLIVYNPPSSCSDTLIKTVESFSPPLVGIEGFQTFCPGEKTTLKAYGAYEYKWSTGENTDSITIGSPGGEIWMEGFSSTGCRAKVDLSIYEEPFWPFTVSDVSIICKGDTLKLEADGAIDYIWNTGEQTSSILVSKAGSYRVTGTNPRGCIKQRIVNLIEDDLPGVDFTLSAYHVNKRHNTITGNIQQENLVTYLWDMGDGAQGSGNNFSHSYNPQPHDLEYDVNLTASNENGCTNSALRKVLVDLFVPNVFTPNEDGTNDVFMPGYFVQVFDRNGTMLYTGLDGWDGKYKGNDMDTDTYFYVVEYENAAREKLKKQGYLTLIR